jgi:HEAT repeat protein
MRVIQMTMVLAVLLVTATLMGQAQTTNKNEIEQKMSRERVHGKTFFEWSNDLHDKDLSTQEQAITELKFFGKAARREIPHILKAMGHKDVSMRVNAVITLGFVGIDPSQASDVLNKLKGLLYDNQQIVRYQAATTLLRLAQTPEHPYLYEATPALINALHQEANSWEVRVAAAKALAWVAWPGKAFDKDAWRALMRASHPQSEPNSEVRFNAVWSLILFGRPFNAQDIALEEKHFQSLTGMKENKKVAIWAHVGIMRITDQVSDKDLRGIAKFLRDKDAAIRLHAVQALAIVGPAGASQVPALVEVLDDEDPSVVMYAAHALGNMGDKAREAEAALTKRKAHQDPLVRAEVEDALKRIKEKIRIDDPTPTDKKKR